MISLAARVSLRLEQRDQTILLVGLKALEDRSYRQPAGNQNKDGGRSEDDISTEQEGTDGHQTNDDDKPPHVVEQYAVEGGCRYEGGCAKQIQEEQVSADPQQQTKCHGHEDGCGTGVRLQHD